MSKGLNKVLLLGNVGRDPEKKSTGSVSVVNFSLATTSRRKQGDEWVDETTWHDLVAFGKTAEVASEYLRKGSQVYVEGKLRTRSWDDKETGAKRYKTEIVVDELILLGGKPNSETASQPAPTAEITDDDVPF